MCLISNLELIKYTLNKGNIYDITADFDSATNSIVC